MVQILDREFDVDKLNKSHPSFDREAFNDYRKFLISIPEVEVINMPIEHAYARIKFIGQEEQQDYLRKAGYIPVKDRPHSQTQPTPRNGGPTKIYKNWTND